MKNQTSEMGRRGFLRLVMVSAGVATLSVAAKAQVANPPPADPQTQPSDVLRILSGESLLTPATHHTHFLDIPLTTIANPPAEGVRLKTTTTLFHHHVAPLTQAQLAAIAQGQKVSVMDTVKDHVYTIFLAPEN